MPELPEVETIARGLAPGLLGRKIVEVRIFDKSVAPDSEARLKALTLGREITRVWRRAKLMLIDLASPSGELSHLTFQLKMTGRLWINAPSEGPLKHVRLQIVLDDGEALYFHDVRRFGVCRALTPDELCAWKFYASLGPEPWDMDAQTFAQALNRRGGKIKPLLLDQTVIAGIGNIYADEALFRARIAPDTPPAAIKAPGRKRLLAAIQEVIAEAIAVGGSTIRDYRTAEGVEGGFQHKFKVYGRYGEPCHECSATLKKLTLAGRTSTYCPNCQK